MRDYVAGRCEELDSLLTWVEQQDGAIDADGVASSGTSGPMVDAAPSLREFSRQLWGMLNPLVKESTVATTSANVPRHNGLEAWRRLAEPVNVDKALLQKDRLPGCTNPKAAPSADRIEQAIEDWDTDIQLFVKAGGSQPLDCDRRLTLIQILPANIAAYITMHMELPEYNTYEKLKKKAESSFVKALPYLEAAYDLKPEDKNTLLSLKQLYYLNGDYKKSEEMKLLIEELK